MAKYIEKIQEFLKEKKVEALLLKSKTMKKYLDTMTGSGCQVLITLNGGYLLLDGRYLEEAKQKEKQLEIICTDNINDSVIEILASNKINTLALENDQTSIKQYQYYTSNVKNVVLFDEEIGMLRIIKDDEEIQRVQKAVDLTDEIYQTVRSKIKLGMTEYEISALLHYYAIKNGAQQMSFDTIVTSGPRTALPHGRPTSRKIELHDPIMMDFGIQYNNYQSDMTRMVFVGTPTEKMVDIYNTVLKAQTTALDSIRVEKTGYEIDKVARDIITDAGYGEYFDHGLGHGIGIGDGNEFPRLNKTSKTILQENMIMSCEPGVYVPGIGGVRIEDDVLIKNGKGIALNHTSKDLFIIKGE